MMFPPTVPISFRPSTLRSFFFHLSRDCICYIGLPFHQAAHMDCRCGLMQEIGK